MAPSWGGDVAQLVRASDRHAADAGSNPRCGKGFFSQSQLSVQTLLRYPYTSCAFAFHVSSVDYRNTKTPSISRWLGHPPPPSQFFNHEGRWCITDDFATSFLHLSLFATALWDLANSRPVHPLMLSSHHSLCPPCLLPPFTVPCKMVLARPNEGKNDHTTAVCVSLRSSGGLRVVQLPAGSWHGLPRW